jgi:hypothetical protein
VLLPALALGEKDRDCFAMDFNIFRDDTLPSHCALYAQVSSWHHIDSGIEPTSSMALFEGSYKRLGN